MDSVDQKLKKENKETKDDESNEVFHFMPEAQDEFVGLNQ